MLRRKWTAAVFAMASLGLMTPAQGDQIADMQAELDALSVEIATVRANHSDNWLNERRAEEVKGLIMEVLSDADTRASLLNDGATAGYGEDGFYIMSPDGAFSLYISGQLQFQYVYNNQEDTTLSNGDDDEGGFQTRRAKIKFDGHVADPRINYHVELAREFGSTMGDIILEEWNVSYDVNDKINIAGGKMKLPFLREELVNSTHQLAVERSTVNEFFTIGRSEGVRLRYTDGPILINFMLSDGANRDEDNDFDDDESELALTARLDWLLQGERSQGDDFTGWSGEPQFLNIGIAYHLQLGDGRNSAERNYHAHTIDVQWENGPLNAFAAYIGAEIQEDNAALDNREMDGFVGQVGVHVIPDKVEIFGRWEYIDGDFGTEDKFDAYTVGFNYFINGHRTKFTADVVWLNEDAPTPNDFGSSFGTGFSANNTGLGLIDGKDGEMAIRTQFQLLF